MKSYPSHYIITMLLLALISFTGCDGQSRKLADKAPQSKAVDQLVPVFNADSAYAYVAKQIAFGPRVPESKAHAACADWFTDVLGQWADTVIVQEFKTRIYNKTAMNGKNIIAVFNPSATKRILLSSHWDSRPYADHDADPARRRLPIDGANDGASGVGILLEIARQLHLHPIQGNVGIDIVLFDLEDYGPPTEERNYFDEDMWALGSQYWSRNLHKPGYSAQFGILLDMVGAKNPIFPREYYSQQYASWVLDKVWRNAYKLGFGDYFVNKPGSPIDDDHIPINKVAGIPTINIIHLDPNSVNGTFYDHWHTSGDSLDKIDPKTLDMVGRVLMTTIYGN